MATSLKQEAHALIERMPDEVTWDDLMYEVMVRREIEKGLQDVAAGRVLTVEEVRRRFGLSE